MKPAPRKRKRVAPIPLPQLHEPLPADGYDHVPTESALPLKAPPRTIPRGFPVAISRCPVGSIVTLVSGGRTFEAWIAAHMPMCGAVGSVRVASWHQDPDPGQPGVYHTSGLYVLPGTVAVMGARPHPAMAAQLTGADETPPLDPVLARPRRSRW